MNLIDHQRARLAGQGRHRHLERAARATRHLRPYLHSLRRSGHRLHPGRPGDTRGPHAQHDLRDSESMSMTTDLTTTKRGFHFGDIRKMFGSNGTSSLRQFGILGSLIVIIALFEIDLVFAAAYYKQVRFL